MSWHTEHELLGRYAAGELDEAQAMSLEAHLSACADCRGSVAPIVDPAPLELVWSRVEAIVDAPARGPVEEMLVRCGVPDQVARLLAATPSLTLSWLAAVASALLFAVVAAHESDRGLLAFLALAPLLPLAGVAAAYGPRLDPTFEVALASPTRGFRLLLIRSAAVLTTTTVLSAVAAAALPGFGWHAAAWLLPALALTSLSLALATYVPVAAASGAVASAWVALVTLGAAYRDEFVAAGAEAQLASLAVAIVSATVVAHRRTLFDVERSR